MNTGLEAMKAYLAALPRGIDSYPESQMKGSVVRAILTMIPPHVNRAGMPEEVRPLAVSPPLTSAWVSDVQASALLVFMSHEYYESMDRFAAQTYRANFELLDSLVYRMLFKLVGVRRIAQHAPGHWALFHRGTEVQVQGFDEDAGHVSLLLHTPAHQVTEPVAHAYATSYRAAFEIAGKTHVRFDLVFHSPTRVEFRGRWR